MTNREKINHYIEMYQLGQINADNFMSVMSEMANVLGATSSDLHRVYDILTRKSKR